MEIVISYRVHQHLICVREEFSILWTKNIHVDHDFIVKINKNQT